MVSFQSIKVDIWTQSKMWLKRFSLKRQTQHAPATNPVPSAPSDDLPSSPLAFVKQSEVTINYSLLRFFLSKEVLVEEMSRSRLMTKVITQV